MKTIKNITKRPIKLGVHTLNYLDSITINESDIPEYLLKRIKSLEISRIIEVITTKGEESTNPKLTLEQIQEEEYQARLMADAIANEEVIVEEPIIELETAEIVEEPIQEEVVAQELIIEESVESEEAVEPKPKKRGRPKKEEGNE